MLNAARTIMHETAQSCVVPVLVAMTPLAACEPPPPPTFLEECESDADCGGGLTCEERDLGTDAIPQQCTKACASDDDCNWGDCSLGAIALGTPMGVCNDDGFCYELQCR